MFKLMNESFSCSKILIITFTFLAISCHVCYCRNRTINLLHRHLFDDYTNDVRPVYNTSTATKVIYRALFRNLLNLDSKLQTYTVTCWLKMTWYDEFLTWNPEDFDGIKRLHVPITKVWTPDITLEDNADVSFERFKPNTVVQVFSDGTIIWFVPTVYSSPCLIRVKWFPFYIQMCDLVFLSWAHNGLEIDLQAEESLDASTVRYLSNGVWDMVAVRNKRILVKYLCCPEPYPQVHYRVIFKRHHEFYIYYMVLPCAFLSVLSLLVFYLPPDCGEKLTLSITNLLALVVFQQIIAENMPPSSDGTPVIGNYFLCMIVMVCISVIATVFVIHLSAISQPVPPWVKQILLNIIPRMIFLTISDGPQTDQISPGSSGAVWSNHGNEGIDIKPGFEHVEVSSNGVTANKTESESQAKSNSGKQISAIVSTLDYLKADIEIKNAESKEHTQWRRVSIVVDRVLLYLFSLFLTVCTILFTTQIIVGSSEDYDDALREFDEEWYKKW